MWYIKLLNLCSYLSRIHWWRVCGLVYLTTLLSDEIVQPVIVQFVSIGTIYVVIIRNSHYMTKKRIYPNSIYSQINLLWPLINRIINLPASLSGRSDSIPCRSTWGLWWKGWSSDRRLSEYVDAPWQCHLTTQAFVRVRWCPVTVSS